MTSVRIITAPSFNLSAHIGPGLSFLLFTAWHHFPWMALLTLLPAFLLGWLARRWCTEGFKTSRKLQFQEKLAEHTRLARDLNDSLLQTIEASKMIADDALDPHTDPAHMRRTMRRLSDWLGQATKEGQQALDSLRPPASGVSDRTATPSSQWIGELSSRLLPSRKKRGR